MQVTNVVINKEDAEVENLAISVFNTDATDPEVNELVDYNTLTPEQKAIADAFYALAVSLIPG